MNSNIAFFFQNVAVELVLKQEDVPGSQHENILLVSECNPLSLSTSFVDRLKSGFKDYVLKSGNSLQRKCESCLPSWYVNFYCHPDCISDILSLILELLESINAWVILLLYLPLI